MTPLEEGGPTLKMGSIINCKPLPKFTPLFQGGYQKFWFKCVKLLNRAVQVMWRSCLAHMTSQKQCTNLPRWDVNRQTWDVIIAPPRATNRYLVYQRHDRTGIRQPVIIRLKAWRGGDSISDCPQTSIQSIILTIIAKYHPLLNSLFYSNQQLFSKQE